MYLYILYKIRCFARAKELVQIHYSLVYPHFIHDLNVWSGCYVTTLKPIKTLQNRLMQAIAGANYREPAEPIYRRFRLLRNQQIYRYMTGAYVYESLSSGLPSIFSIRIRDLI